MPLRKHGNWLLCTLLLGNTLVNALIAIFLADMTSGVVGGIVTTALIVVFGEIIPQSVCSRYSLEIGARAVPIVWLFVIVCGVVAWPISKILDSLLGPDPQTHYSKGEFAEILKRNLDGKTDDQEEETRVALGAMEFGKELVKKHMTPLDRTFQLDIDEILDLDNILEVAKTGHTRIPVYDSHRENIVAILLTKDLLGVGYERKVPVREVIHAFNADERVIKVPGEMNLKEAKHQCSEQRKHLLVVTDNAHGAETALGVITMEDIIEEIIKEEIVDETDLVLTNASSKRNIDRVQPTTLLDSLVAKEQYYNDAVSALVEAAKLETDPDVGKAQVEAIGLLATSSPTVVKAGLMALLQHSLPQVRQTAAEQLGILCQLRAQLVMGAAVLQNNAETLGLKTNL
mmetsp:Transcript_118176/g.227965  ORF Transcript_118176/g.227965 Transcript_118176/m.227965 type:complete len:401 (-) Transcript_118176:42-1244(-)